MDHYSYELAHEIDREIGRSLKYGNKFASLHEGYAIILEELDEFWEIVRQKQSERNLEEARKELIQIAAMAIKGIQSLDSGNGRV